MQSRRTHIAVAWWTGDLIHRRRALSGAAAHRVVEHHEDELTEIIRSDDFNVTKLPETLCGKMQRDCVGVRRESRGHTAQHACACAAPVAPLFAKLSVADSAFHADRAAADSQEDWEAYYLEQAAQGEGAGDEGAAAADGAQAEGGSSERGDEL